MKILKTWHVTEFPQREPVRRSYSGRRRPRLDRERTGSNMAWRPILTWVLLGWLCASGALSGLAQSVSSVTLMWNASPGPDLAGYYMYYGLASHAYTSKIFVGNSTVATIPGLQPGATYYFAVTAFDSLGKESKFSNELSYSEPGQATTPLALSSIGDRSSSEGSGPVSASFTISTAPSRVANLAITATSSNPALVPNSNIMVNGSGTTRSLLITPIAGASGAATITLNVSDGISSATTSFTVTLMSQSLPAIVLNLPASGSSYTAPASIGLAATVTASGHVINKVQFYNGGSLLAEDSAAPYTFTWTGVGAGSYNLSSRVIYDGGAGVDSASVTVRVANPPPILSLSSPAAGTAYSAPASLDLAATVQPNGHTINKVQFYNGSTLLGESLSPPYAWTWTGVGAGTYSLKATAIYDGSITVDSPTASVTVNNTSLPLPWQTADIGQPGSPGSASASGGDYLLAGAGNIGGTSDNFRFVYQPLSGDGWILAQVASLKSSAGTGSIGVMMRESLSSNARCAYVGVSAGGALFSQSRSGTGNSSTAASIDSGSPPNITLYLFRTGDSFYYYTYNGISWVWGNIGTISMASNIYVGLAAASGSASTLLSGHLEQVTTFP